MTSFKEKTINLLHKNTLLVLLGPTGIGKTDISMELAKYFQAPILSSASRQIYREIPIGTAAPTLDELEKIKHYFIASRSIFDSYNSGDYEQDAIALLEDLFKKHKVVMLVGGSMMYIDAVCKGFDEMPSVDNKTREYWQNIYNLHGLEYIQKELKKLDPLYYKQVDLMNYKRILHALEICTITGNPYSELRTGIVKKRNFNILKIGLNRPRHELYERINKRVDIMMKDGLLEEATELHSYKDLNALNTVGYKELFEYIDANLSLDEAVQKIKRNSRRYAKRQLTWFRRDEEINWFHPDNVDEVIAFVESKLSN